MTDFLLISSVAGFLASLLAFWIDRNLTRQRQQDLLNIREEIRLLESGHYEISDDYRRMLLREWRMILAALDSAEPPREENTNG